jgi:hypothetical protein
VLSHVTYKNDCEGEAVLPTLPIHLTKSTTSQFLSYLAFARNVLRRIMLTPQSQPGTLLPSTMRRDIVDTVFRRATRRNFLPMTARAFKDATSLALIVGSEALEFAFFACWAVSKWVVRRLEGTYKPYLRGP